MQLPSDHGPLGQANTKWAERRQGAPGLESQKDVPPLPRPSPQHCYSHFMLFLTLVFGFTFLSFVWAEIFGEWQLPRVGGGGVLVAAAFSPGQHNQQLY